MKTLIILLTAVLFLNTNSAMSSPNDLSKIKKSVRNQVNYALATANIEEKGTVTIYFFVFDKKVKIQKVEGNNETLNQKVAQRLESFGFTKKGLTGYYTVTIRMNGSTDVVANINFKNELKKMVSAYYSDLLSLPMPE